MTTTTARNSNVELLRLLLMCMIFAGHVITHGFGFKGMAEPGFAFAANPWIAIPIAAIAQPATMCFVFISGWYGIRLTLRRLLQLTLWCSLAAFLCHVAASFYGMAYDVQDMLKTLFGASCGAGWFVTQYALLMILSPLINEGLERLGRQRAGCLLLILFVFNATQWLTRIPGVNTQNILFMYMLGRYVSTNKDILQASQGGGVFTLIRLLLRRPANCLVVLLVLQVAVEMAVVALASAGVVQGELFKVYRRQLYNHYNPLNEAAAVALFLAVRRLPELRSATINRLLSANLFIYLLTDSTAAEDRMMPWLAGLFSHDVALALAVSVAIIATCLAVGKLCEAVTNWLLDRLKITPSTLVFVGDKR